MSPTTTKNSGTCPENIQGLVCLPPISEDLQLIWIQTGSTSELDDHPQLLHTFSYFPYPTMPEIALLCLRNGLQMEKVKAWFMVQRLRCGISWTSEEIEETRSRLLYSQDQLHFQCLLPLARKNNGFQSSEKLATCTSKTESKHEVSAAPLSPAKGSAAPEAKRMRMDNYDSEVDQVEANMDITEHRTHSPSNARDYSYRYGEHSPNVNLYSDCHPERQSTSRIPTASHSAVASLLPEEDYHRRMESPSGKNIGFLSSQFNDYHDESNGGMREYSTPGSRRQRKTKEQLAILKSFFLKCQWASREDYKDLEDITGLPRAEIIQWFGDTRYALKHGQLRWFRENAPGRPSWLDEPQHLVPQNGKSADSKSSGGKVLAKGSPEPEVYELDLSLAGQLTRTSPVQALDVQTPDVLSDSSKTKASEEMDDKLANPESAPVESGKDGMAKNDLCTNDLRTKVSQTMPTDPQAKDKSPRPSPVPAKSTCVAYEDLEKYWLVNRHFKEEDCQSLAEKSGLSREEVTEWFCRKSSEPAEVEVCLDDEVEEDDEEVGEDYDKGEAEEEEVDDIVIQD